MRKNRSYREFVTCRLVFTFFVFTFLFSVKAFPQNIFTDKLSLAKSSSLQTSRSKGKKEKFKKKVKKSNVLEIPPGIWGAAGINFTVSANSGVIIEYDCADAEISQKPEIDEQGNFSLNGFYVSRGGGAMRINQEFKKQTARFDGKIYRDKLTLKVTLTESGQQLEEVVLERGKTGRIRSCY